MRKQNSLLTFSRNSMATIGLFARFYRQTGSAILLQKQVSKASIAKIVGISLPPFTALSRQGGYAHILKGYFYTNLGGTLGTKRGLDSRFLPNGLWIHRLCAGSQSPTKESPYALARAFQVREPAIFSPHRAAPEPRIWGPGSIRSHVPGAARDRVQARPPVRPAPPSRWRVRRKRPTNSAIVQRRDSKGLA